MNEEIKQKIKEMVNNVFHWIAVDKNGDVFAFTRKPILHTSYWSNDDPSSWGGDGNITCIGKLEEGTFGDWKDTLFCLDDEPKEQPEPKKKLVIEIKEFSNGECAYLVKKSVGKIDKSISIGTDFISYASSKQSLLDIIQQQFIESTINGDIYTWEEK